MIGREKEIKVLMDAFQADESKFIAVYGRRRIGKTYLIRETFSHRFAFQHAGAANGNLRQQLFEFTASMKEAGFTDFKKPVSWLEAFEILKDLIRQSSEKKKIIFLDELSWMDTPKSDFMVALESFWNGWASNRKDILLIVCSSSTSWILNHVIHNKGGLYNRLSAQIHLEPFTLSECEKMVQTMHIVFTRQQILLCYMIMGGVPFYWSLLKRGLSFSQNIDEIFFSENAPLKNEFEYLYASIFKKPDDHIKIIEALSDKKFGLTRDEIISKTKLTNSGALTKKLEELEECGFIRKYNAFGSKKKNAIYQIIDCFTLFYYSFAKRKPDDPHFWSNQINTPAINTWQGLAFERVCLLHIKQLKNTLGISGVLTQVNSWYCTRDADEGIYGSQIDLMIVRRDQVINICEMKYSEYDYTVTEKDVQSMKRKIQDFQYVTKCKYAIHPTLITTNGISENAYAYEFQNIITLDDLFAF